MPDRLFTNMTPAARQFYHRVFNRVLLNLHAVRTGLFDTLFCETEDPRVMGRWTTELPRIVEQIRVRGSRGFGED